MAGLLQSWKDSFTLFLSANIVPLLFVTGKTWFDLYFVLVRNFWWFFIVMLVVMLAYFNWMIIIAFLFVWLALVVFAARPSLHKKDWCYFSGFFIYAIPFSILFLLPFGFTYTVMYALAPFLLLSSFFLCDSDLQPKYMIMAPVRALVMSLYKLPIYLMLVLLFYLCSFVPYGLGLFIIVPLLVVLISRLYVLWIHTDYERYYGTSK